MAESYKWGYNPMKDIILEYLQANIDISTSDNKAVLYGNFGEIVNYFSNDVNDVTYMDFDVEKKGNYYKIKGNNFPTALWLSGCFPQNPKTLMKTKD